MTIARVWLPALGGLALIASWTSVAAADECRGGKQWYQGACRYPHEIEELKGNEKPAPTPTPPPRSPPQPPPTPFPTIPIPPPPTPTPTPTPQPPPAVVPPPVVPAPAMPQPYRPPARVSISPLVWVGAGVAGAGLIVGAITGGISFGQAKDIQKKCPTDKTCPMDQQDNIDEMKLLANVSNVSFGVAGAGAIVGIIGLVITDWSPSPEMAVSVSPTPGGVVLTGSF